MIDIKESIIITMTEAMMEEIPTDNVDAGDVFNAAIAAYHVCVNGLIKEGIMEEIKNVV